MNIPEAYDLTGTLQDATELAGCSHHTVARYAAERERSQAGRRAAEMIDEFMPKLEELIKRSKGEDPRRRGTREDHRDGGLPGPGAPHGGWWRSRRQPGIQAGDGCSAFGCPSLGGGRSTTTATARTGAMAAMPGAMKAPAAGDAWPVGGARIRAGQAVTASPAARLTGSGARAGPARLRHGQRSGLLCMMRS